MNATHTCTAHSTGGYPYPPRRTPPPSPLAPQVYTRSGSGSATLTQPQVSGLCHQAGIAGPVVAKVLEVGAFDPAAIDMHKFVFLMLAMSCEDFNRWGQGGAGRGEKGVRR